MKITTLKSVAIAVGLAAPAFGQATSNVVGYETINLSASFNFIGIRLHESPVASGDLETVGAASVEDDDFDFTILDANTLYVLEIEDGSGNIVEFLGSDVNAGAVATNFDLSAAGVANGAPYTVRPASTLLSIFGEASESVLTSGTSAGASDQILVPDGTGGFDTYFILTSGGFGGQSQDWVQLNGDSSTTEINPDEIPLVYVDGIIINAVSAKELVVAGDLKTSATSLALSSSFNFLGSIYPVGASLATTFGVADGGAANGTELVSGTSAGASDQILNPDGAGGFNTYFVQTGGGFGGSTFTWVQSLADGTVDDSIDASTIMLESGYLINAVSGGNTLTNPSDIFDGL